MARKMKTILIVLSVALAVIVVISLAATYLMGKMGMGPMKRIAIDRTPADLTGENVTYHEEEFIATVDGEKVVGALFLPDGMSSASDVVIISHGFASCADLLRAKAKSFALAGVPAMVYDFRGGSNDSKSDGATEAMSVSTEMADLNAMIDAIKKKPGFENTRIYLIGESLGGLITAMVGANRDDVSGLFLCFPAFHTPENARTSFKTKEDIPQSIDMFGMRTGSLFWQELWDLDLYTEITKYTGDVLIFYGTKDPAVPFQYIKKANDVYLNSTAILVEGAGHGFDGDNEKSVLKTIYEQIRTKRGSSKE